MVLIDLTSVYHITLPLFRSLESASFPNPSLPPFSHRFLCLIVIHDQVIDQTQPCHPDLALWIRNVRGNEGIG